MSSLTPAFQWRSQSGAAAAERELQRALRVLSLSEEAVGRMPKGAPEKALLAWWLRRRTTVALRWGSERLGMATTVG
jgi:hypothetical protein